MERVGSRCHAPCSSPKCIPHWCVKCAVDLPVVEWQDVYVTTGLLAGREKKIADIHVRHPSCSSQHAVLQYRQVKDPKTGKTKVRPYIMDLQSTNGAFKAKGDGLRSPCFQSH